MRVRRSSFAFSALAVLAALAMVVGACKDDAPGEGGNVTSGDYREIIKKLTLELAETVLVDAGWKLDTESPGQVQLNPDQLAEFNREIGAGSSPETTPTEVTVRTINATKGDATAVVSMVLMNKPGLAHKGVRVVDPSAGAAFLNKGNTRFAVRAKRAGKPDSKLAAELLDATLDAAR